MHQVVEFATNHIALVSVFVVLLVAVFYQEMLISGIKEQLSLPKAVDFINNDQALVLDVRSRSMFEGGHIVGAKSVTLSQLKKTPEEFIEKMEDPVLLVCAKGTNTGSLAYQLKQQGYSQVKVLAGGMARWAEDGMPVAKGKK